MNLNSTDQLNVKGNEKARPQFFGVDLGVIFVTNQDTEFLIWLNRTGLALWRLTHVRPLSSDWTTTTSEGVHGLLF